MNRHITLSLEDSVTVRLHTHRCILMNTNETH
jgi:hypothetical protein